MLFLKTKITIEKLGLTPAHLSMKSPVKVERG
jgi:hypothetical protein